MFLTVRFKNLISVFVLVLLLTIVTAVFAGIENNDEVPVPIIMYHSILKDTSQSKKYIVTPDELESDLKYLKENGYTTITISDLINYVYNDKILPEKPIILSFDDGYYNNYYYAFQLMQKYNMKMVISIVGSYTERSSIENNSNPSYSSLTWEQISEMEKSGYAEFLNHTYDLHRITSARHGCKKNKGESLENYKKVLTEDLTKLQNKLFETTGKTPVAFTYPFGGVSNASCDIIKDLGFKASLSCKEGINLISSDKDCLYLLKRILRPSGIESKEFFYKILQ